MVPKLGMDLNQFLVLTFAFGIASATPRSELLSILDTDEIRESAKNLSQIPIEGQITFPELARAHDLKCIEHAVATEDGYVLKVFQVPGNSQSPVLLVPGYLDSSDSFILTGASSLIFALSKTRGCDVWVANLRGNFYSRRHIHLNPDESEFWDFSLEEMAVYDLPAIIDYILNQTGQISLPAIAHDEGATSFLVMGSIRREYNDKVHSLVAMAPLVPTAAHSNQLATPILRLFLSSVQGGELFGRQTSLMIMFKSMCAIQTEMTYKMCSVFVSALSGNAEFSGMDDDFLTRLIGHYPAGTSVKNAMHLVQIMESNKLARFDYGPDINMQKYKSQFPPEFDLERVTMPVALIFAKNDKVSTPGVAKSLRRRLPNVVNYYVNDDDHAHHMDFLWGSPKYVELVRHIIHLIM